MRYATAVLLAAAGVVAASTWLPEKPTTAPVGRAQAPAITNNSRPPEPPEAGPARKAPPYPDPLVAVLRDLDQEIAELGRQAPRYPDDVRRQFDEAPDLFGFVHDILPRAEEGDAASLYHVYLALEECRAYLGQDPAVADARYARALSRTDPWSAAERPQVHEEYTRCRGFAGADLAPLTEAMDNDVPGAVTEYAAVWFERAVRAGYPPALANLALRPYPFTRAERLDLLGRAITTGDPDVAWRVFAQASLEGAPEAIDATTLAWLIVACRAGADCREQAPWYAWRCSRSDGRACHRGDSAIEHYWYSLPQRERLQAWWTAVTVEARLRVGELDSLPWPELPVIGSDRNAPG